MIAQEIAAGRELDLDIAEKLMGWRWIAGRHYDVSTVDQPIWLLPPDMSVRDVGPGEWTFYRGEEREKSDPRLTVYDVPRYSTDIAAAWTVVEHLNNNGHWLFVLSQPHDGNMPTVLAFQCGARPYAPITIFEHLGHEIEFAQEYNRPLIRAGGETMPLAICRAALLAVGKR